MLAAVTKATKPRPLRDYERRLIVIDCPHCGWRVFPEPPRVESGGWALPDACPGEPLVPRQATVTPRYGAAQRWRSAASRNVRLSISRNVRLLVVRAH